MNRSSVVWQAVPAVPPQTGEPWAPVLFFSRSKETRLGWEATEAPLPWPGCRCSHMLPHAHHR